jgi:hypothetical protein
LYHQGTWGYELQNVSGLLFLHSADSLVAHKTQVSFDSINDKVDLIYHDLESVTDRHQTSGRKIIKFWQVRTPALINLLIKSNALVNSSVEVRKSLLQ